MSMSQTFDLAQALSVAQKIKNRVEYDVMGRSEVIELSLIALLSGGHILLEDYPGSGKTTLAKALGLSIEEQLSETAQNVQMSSFRRIQFTPDMLPSDITGVMVFDSQKSEFYFRQGPIFAHILLVDEINRTSPKVQSAMLEAMAEKQVTVDNQTYPLKDLFFVIATQNPLDSVGTYPLPTAQLDRFLFKIRMEHISQNAELDVLESWGKPRLACDLPKVALLELKAAMQAIQTQVNVHKAIQECLVEIAQKIRTDKRCAQGISTRSLVQAIPALQARAMLKGRNFVSSDDITALAKHLFLHRISLIPGVRDGEAVIKDALVEPIEKLSKRSLS
jgi:MoxR-like ATPase